MMVPNLFAQLPLPSNPRRFGAIVNQGFPKPRMLQGPFGRYPRFRVIYKYFSEQVKKLLVEIVVWRNYILLAVSMVAY